MPCLRAISVTTAPGASVSSMIRILSSRDQRRRRSTPPRTSTRIYPTLRLALKLDLRRIPVTQQGGLPRRNTEGEPVGALNIVLFDLLQTMIMRVCALCDEPNG